MRAIPIDNVISDSILGEDLYTSEGKILLRENSTLTENLLSKIKSNKIYTIYVKDRHSDHKVNRMLEQSFRVKGSMLIKDIFEFAATAKSIFDLHNELSAYADDVLYEIKSYSKQVIEYIDIKNVDAYLFSSSLNVALISALIAWEVGYNDDMVKHIFIGAIYHDIGMALLPYDVINKTEALTLEEKRMIIDHPKIGYEYIKDKTFLSAYVKTIVLQHHEYLDGSGYPTRLKATDINPIAQIIGIADIYDAMTSDRPYKRAVAPKEAIEYILGIAGSKFDAKITTAFINLISPYPRGTIVRLSNDHYAVVDELNPNFPLRPKIRIIVPSEDKDTYEYKEVNLLEQQNLVITDIVYENI
jgi:HD-GYP domain-containing protein (c-di-GMP phosphodiesterase class II)